MDADARLCNGRPKGEELRLGEAGLKRKLMVARGSSRLSGRKGIGTCTGARTLQCCLMQPVHCLLIAVPPIDPKEVHQLPKRRLQLRPQPRLVGALTLLSVI